MNRRSANAVTRTQGAAVFTARRFLVLLSASCVSTAATAGIGALLLPLDSDQVVAYVLCADGLLAEAVGGFAYREVHWTALPGDPTTGDTIKDMGSDRLNRARLLHSFHDLPIEWRLIGKPAIQWADAWNAPFEEARDCVVGFPLPVLAARSTRVREVFAPVSREHGDSINQGAILGVNYVVPLGLHWGVGPCVLSHFLMWLALDRGVAMIVRSRRVARGNCVHCGYQLVQSGLRCPECGMHYSKRIMSSRQL
jgi:hypothetical protein